MKLFTLIFCSFILWGCESSLKTEESLPYNSDPENISSSFIVVADPQIHNIYGDSLKQMFGVSDLVSRVAVRPAEVNILAKYSLEELLKKALGRNPKKEFSLVLGDATNIACSSEFEIFKDTMNKVVKGNNAWLMAHGNHDSYLMGTVNSYVVADGLVANPWSPEVAEYGMPKDTNLWNVIEPNGEQNWRDACYRDKASNTSISNNKKSSPMNKMRWIAKYIKHLEAYKIKITSNKFTPSDLNHDSNKTIYHELNSVPNSNINGNNFRLKGVFIEPIIADTPSKTDLLMPYESYIVQSYDLDESTWLLIIDTSVCKYARAKNPFMYYRENAGTHACIGELQFADIKYMIDKHEKSGKNLIVAGHSNLGSLNYNEEKAVIKILNEYIEKDDKKSWTYLSAHTHNPINFKKWDKGKEINVGSTTDWPMESHKFHINVKNGEIALRQTFYFDDPLQNEDNPPYPKITYKHYSRPFFKRAPELCRHLSTAKALSEHRPNEEWRSPVPDYNCLGESSDNDWKDKVSELKKYVATIDRNMKIIIGYKQEMFNILATASRAERKTFSLAE